jgi:DNA polymerase-3 subunit alpha
VLEKAVELIAPARRRVDLATLPLDDQPTFAMLARGETVGVFQVEGQGMRTRLVGMKADRLEDLIALVSLYRPGRWTTSFLQPPQARRGGPGLPASAA